MNQNTALDSFFDKWRDRWPEWPLAETFVPPAQREQVVAWFALLQEFEDVMNVAGDPLPADAKQGWWGEELRDWSRRRSRHPLGRVLEPQGAPWGQLSDALPALKVLREPWTDLGTAMQAVRPLADAIVAVEAALFGGQADAASVQAVSSQWLVARWLGRGQAQGEGLAELLGQWPARSKGSLPRRLFANLARRRAVNLQAHGDDPRAVSRLGLLWSSWRAARG